MQNHNLKYLDYSYGSAETEFLLYECFRYRELHVFSVD
jgi:hypothetical protein